MIATASVRRVALVLLFALLAAAPPAWAQDAIPIAEARDAGEGATVTVEGVVTRAFGSFARVQDTTGTTGASALVVRQTDEAADTAFRDAIAEGTIAPGTRLRVTGTLSEFNGLLQINNDRNTDNLDSFEVLSQGDVPAPQVVTLGELEANGEDYESELVRVEGLRFTGDTDGTFEAGTSYSVTDGAATLTFRVQRADESALIGEEIPDEAFTFTGVVGQFQDEYQLIPVRPADLAAPSAASVQIVGRPYALAYEEGGEPSAALTVRASGLAEDEEVTVTLSVREGSPADVADVEDFGGTRALTFSGPGASSQTVTFTATGDDADEGIEPLQLMLSTEDEDASVAGAFTLWILDDPAAQTTLFPELEGQALRDSLRAVFASGDDEVGPPTLGYDTARDTLYSVVFNDGGVVRGYYTGHEATLDGGDPSQDVFDEDVNTEHVWPRSQGADDEPALSNMHILVPAWAPANSARCNYPFAEINDAQTERWFGAEGGMGEILDIPPPAAERDAYSEAVGSDCDAPSDDGRFEPRESVKGDAARKSFYFAMAYPTRASGSFLAEQKDILRRWNAEDPVDATEQRRNVLIASYQGDALNPFQLDSTLVRRAFFSDEDTGEEVIPIATARERDNGVTVTVEGVFTRIEGSNARIQDESGAGGATGIVVRADTLEAAIAEGLVEPGDRLRVTGPLDSFNGLLQINDESMASSVSFEVIEEDAGVPDVQDVSVAELEANGEDYESELVRVEGLTIDPDGDDVFQAGGAQGNYVATGPDGTEITLRIPGTSFYGGQPIPEGEVTFTGVLGQFGTDSPANGYQLLAIAAGDLDTGGETLDVSIRRTFGDPDASTGYRLVALPGDVSRPLAGTIEGEAGSDWQAYWDTGAEEDFFVRWDGSETFTFQPGRGFWLIAEEAWTVETTVPAVERDEDGAFAISLHEGWNIISNPLAEGVDWADVEAANGGTLQPLWGWMGSFSQAETFASAAEGVAYYFLNDQDLETLALPAPAEAAPNQRTAAAQRTSAPTLTLAAYDAGGALASSARIRIAPGAAEGRDAQDWIAPPARFEAVSLRFDGEGTAPERERWLAQDARPEIGSGQAFALTLRGTPGRTVTLRPQGLSAFAEQEVVLVDEETGERFDLHAAPEVALTLGGEAAALRLLIGPAAFAEGEAGGLPHEFALQPNWPNPFRSTTQMAYTLPEAREVHAALYDVIGRRVRVLVDERQEAGAHTLTWDGRDASGRPLPSGVYLLKLKAGSEQRTQKIVLVR